MMFAIVGAQVAVAFVVANEARKFGIVLPPPLPARRKYDRCEDAYGLAVVAFFLGIAL